MRTLRNETQNKGITLIALVITIIVLLILAGVSIATLTGDNGLLTKSNEAVVENEKGKERDKIALAYQAVKLDELADSDSSDDITADNLKTALENNGITQATVTAEADGSLTVQMPSGYKYKVTQAGVITYIEEDNVEDTEPEEIAVGDYIAYDCYTGVDADLLTYPTDEALTGTASQTFMLDESFKNTKWIVLDTDGDNILITTADPVLSVSLSGKAGYLTGAGELNNICSIFGHGANAIEGKSMTVEHINKISNYTPSAPQKYWYQYDEEVRWSTTSASSGYSYWTDKYYDKFEYYNGTEWITFLPGEKVSTTTAIEKIDYYYPLETTGIAAKLIYTDATVNEETKVNAPDYWLASQFTRCVTGEKNAYILYGLFKVREGILSAGDPLFSAISTGTTITRSLRPVVTLESGVNLKKDTNGIWQFK